MVLIPGTVSLAIRWISLLSSGVHIEAQNCFNRQWADDEKSKSGTHIFVGDREQNIPGHQAFPSRTLLLHPQFLNMLGSDDAVKTTGQGRFTLGISTIVDCVLFLDIFYNTAYKYLCTCWNFIHSTARWRVSMNLHGSQSSRYGVQVWNGEWGRYSL